MSDFIDLETRNVLGVLPYSQNTILKAHVKCVVMHVLNRKQLPPVSENETKGQKTIIALNPGHAAHDDELMHCAINFEVKSVSFAGLMR